MSSDDYTAVTLEEINACSFYRLLGMEILQLGEGQSRLRLNASLHLCDANGVLARGVIAAACDAAAGMAALSVSGAVPPVTVDLCLTVMREAGPGLLEGKGRVIHMGNEMIISEAWVSDAAGQLIASGVATFITSRHR